METGFPLTLNVMDGCERCFDEFSDVLSEESDTSIPSEVEERVFSEEKYSKLFSDHDMRPGAPFPTPHGQEKRKLAHIEENTDPPPPGGRFN